MTAGVVAVIAFLLDLGPILAGLALGTLANFGLMMDSNASIPARKVKAHLMILGLLGLIVWATSELTHASREVRAIMAGAAGMLGIWLARRFRDWSAHEAARRLPLPPAPPSGDPL